MMANDSLVLNPYSSYSAESFRDVTSDILDIPERVKNIYRSCTANERQYLVQILDELVTYGDSETYRKIWLADYKEIPVDIATFVKDDRYLGKTNRNGEAVYPYWRTVLSDIFSAGNKYEECFFTGATRIGKSSTAITCTAYMLYKLMCLVDPQRYFGKKDVSKFSILFFNITKELASSVAYREFQDTLLASPWFLEHGNKYGSENNPYYVPEGGQIVIDYGSSSAHALGQQVFVGFCLTGETVVLTNLGTASLQDVANNPEKYSSIISYDIQTGTSRFSNFDRVVLTKYVRKTILLILSNGSSVEGTEEHRILCKSCVYTTFKDIEVGSELFCTEGQTTVFVSKKRVIRHLIPVPVYDVVGVENDSNFLIYCGNVSIVSHNCDELNFARAGVKDVNKAKAHMMDLYTTVVDRVKGTFRMGGEVYGKVFAVSSKRSDSDFMEAYMQNQIAAGAGSHMYISDAPQWEVLPPSMFHSEKFYIAVGDRHKRGFVVSEESSNNPDALQALQDQGYTLLTPPIDMKSQFTADFNIALRDLAGISIPGALSFITQEQITQCIGQRKNPFYNEILEIGTHDNCTIEEFFDMSCVDTRLMRMPGFIHLDLSLNDDKTGISYVCISGRSPVSSPDGSIVSLPKFSHLFSVSLQAPRGDNIAYDKIVSFILWLRKQGFNIRSISRDQFQSEYLGQILESKGFGVVPKISLDRTPDGYNAFRSVLAEKRIDLLNVELLQNELIQLQRDSISGKVDHPLGGCFVGDTAIMLADGSLRTIKELADSEDLSRLSSIYSYTRSKSIFREDSITSAFCSKYVDELLTVRLADGTSFTCTPEHRILLYSNKYCPAYRLHPGHKLRSKLSDNCKVDSLLYTYLSEPVPVYDISVLNNSNFVLFNGVVVHNSKDMADSVAGAVWNSILVEPNAPVGRAKVAAAIASVNGRNTLSRENVASKFPGFSGYKKY